MTEPQKRQLVFVDTNILVYAYDRTAGPKHTAAVRLMEQLWENENGCLSIQVLQEFFVSTTKKIPLPLESEVVRDIISDFSHWRVHTPEASDLLQAIDLHRNYLISFWDAMVLQSAVRFNCSHLLSEDLNAGQTYSSVKVINPFKDLE
jgi:predicted nucleic acid-binding protein